MRISGPIGSDALRLQELKSKGKVIENFPCPGIAQK